jgi:hypothetical protein
MGAADGPIGDGCPGTFGAEPPAGPEGLDDPEPPDFWARMGATIRSANNPAVQKQTISRFKEKFMCSLTGRDFDHFSAYARA